MATIYPIKKVYIETPPRATLAPSSTRLIWRVLGTLMSPVNARKAKMLGVPGIEFHVAISKLALKWLINNPEPGARKWLMNLIGYPMVLTRYQEFDFAWRHLPANVEQYLDVSSPSMFPLRVVIEHSNAKGTLLNPDNTDLDLTQQLIKAAKLQTHCKTSAALIGEIDAQDEIFDLITSLSVVEHIPSNRTAIEKMWQLLKPGGTLIITVPCAAQGCAVYTNADQYGLLNKDDRGHTFFEYLYDDSMLEEFIYKVTGRPQAVEIYGEINAGFLQSELQRRWSGEYVRFWDESLLMSREFRRYESISDLPGEGVIGLSFVKEMSG